MECCDSLGASSFLRPWVVAELIGSQSSPFYILLDIVLLEAVRIPRMRQLIAFEVG